MSSQTRPTPTKTKVGPTNSSSSLTNLISSLKANTPLGVRLFGQCWNFRSLGAKRVYHQSLVLALTFIAYAAFHMGRRPLSIVKNVLNHECSNKTTKLLATNSSISSTSLSQAKNYTCDWAPFDNDATANKLLAYLDTAFLLSYAVLMFVSGFVAERVNLRYFISFGAIVSGLALIAFGLSYPLNIHSMAYFVLVQIIAGAAQTTGWPVVVTCVSNWFDRAKLGTIYGLWNSHTNLGNILGATIAGYFVETDWGLSFIVPGVIMIVVGLLLLLFLVPTPLDVNLSSRANSKDEPMEISISSSVATSETNLDLEVSQKGDNISNQIMGSSLHDNPHGQTKAVSFLKALRIPGVIEYSFCLFFSKLVSYTFLYWLPRYITASTSSDSKASAYLSTPFDVGGIAGAIIAGYLSDRFKANGLICNVMLLAAIPSMFAYQQLGSLSSMHNILLQLLVGLLVNGPYCLVTTAVSADLGNKIKDGHAMATVSAIIDGMGSVGAVLGPLFAGFVSTNDWQSVFIMLMISDVLASLCIIRLTIQDIKRLRASD